MRLTATQPRATAEMVASGRAEVLLLDVNRIVDPAEQQYSIQVALLSTAQAPAETVVVGAVTPFPAGRPAKYAMPLSPPAQRLLDARDQVTVVVELVSLAPGRPIRPPLEVQLTVELGVAR